VGAVVYSRVRHIVSCVRKNGVAQLYDLVCVCVFLVDGDVRVERADVFVIV
jgi:hypothetical protein